MEIFSNLINFFIFSCACIMVIILTNLTSRDEGRMKDIMELEPTYYFEKVDWKVADVIEKVKELLAERVI